MPHNDKKSRHRGISPPSLPVFEQLRQWEDKKFADDDIYSGLSGVKVNLSNQTARRECSSAELISIALI